MRHLLIQAVLLLALAKAGAQDIRFLNSDSSVKRFVIIKNYNYPKNLAWAYFDFTNGKEVKEFFHFLNEKQNSVDSISGDRWIFKDLNKDGAKDLVVAGVTKKPEGERFESIYRLLVFLSRSDTDYIQLNLVKHYDENYPVYFNSINVGEENALELISLRVVEFGKYKLAKDTLVYRYNTFIEYNPHPISEKYKEIAFYTSSNWKFHFRDYFRVDNELNGYYKKGSYPDSLSKELYFKMSPADYSSLLQLLNYINVRGIDTAFEKPGWSDIGYSHLRIEFADRNKKLINDYGSSGTYGLLAVYKWIYNYISKLPKQAE